MEEEAGSVMKRTWAVRTILSFLVLAGLAWGQGGDTAEQRSLAGIRELYVWVHDFSPEVQNDGLYAADVQTETELALRKVGLRVLPGHELKNSQTSMLEVHIRPLSLLKECGGYALGLNVELVQTVFLARNPQAALVAPTWSVNSVAYATQGNVVKARSTIQDQVNAFLNAWLAANQK